MMVIGNLENRNVVFCQVIGVGEFVNIFLGVEVVYKVIVIDVCWNFFSDVGDYGWFEDIYCYDLSEYIKCMVDMGNGN